MDSGLGIGGLAISKDEVSSSAFDIFSPIEIENSILRANKLITRPIASTNSRGPFKFVLPSDPEKWTDCESFRLCGKVKIQDIVSGNLTDFVDDKNEISTVNNFFQSLFSSVSCTLNGVEVTDPSGNWYPYKAYLETLLSYSKSTKEGRFLSQCYYQDTNLQYDNLGSINSAGKTTTESLNKGYINRKAFFQIVKLVILIYPYIQIYALYVNTYRLTVSLSWNFKDHLMNLVYYLPIIALTVK